MKKVITYGTFDMLHHGHVRLLERAKTLGDHFIVGITSDSYDQYRGKLNVVDNLARRIENIRATGLADEIIVEEYEGQKIDDIVAREIDVFAIGSDWMGDFDYLREYCEVVYLERTRGISSTDLRNQAHQFIRFGLVGTGPEARAFVEDSKYVSGLDVECVLDEDPAAAQSFCEENQLLAVSADFSAMVDSVDAIYLAAHHDQYARVKEALTKGRHVLCEPPFYLTPAQTNELFDLAQEKEIVLMECFVTHYCPGFQRLISIAKSGRLGEIKHISVSTALSRRAPLGGDAILHRAKWSLLPVYRLLGFGELVSVRGALHQPDGESDHLFLDLLHKGALSSIRLGAGICGEEALSINGTKGYLTTPAPWWKTEYFELHADPDRPARKFYYEFAGEGLRYVLVEFLKEISQKGSGARFRTVSADLAALVEKIKDTTQFQSFT